MDQELLREQCQAYVLGALEGDERAELERLIDQRHPDCLAALHDAREMVAQVAFAAPVADPPAGLRSRVLAAISAEAASKVVPIPASPRRRNYQAWVAWAVAASLLAVTVYVRSQAGEVSVQLARLRGQYTDLETRFRDLSTAALEYRRVLAILTARDARLIRLATAAPDAPQFRAYWSQPAGLVLVGSNVPPPPQGRTLQLWVVPKQGAPVSAGVFNPDQQGQVVLIAETAPPIATAAALAISEEPAGGSPQPTTQPAWIGAISD